MISSEMHRLVERWLTGSAKYWLPISIALVVALGEVDWRRRKSAGVAAEQD